ncbi:hypothetical protein Tco_0635612 [Tanacetum coccineum]
MRKDTEVPRPSGLTTNIADEDVNEENVLKHSNDPCSVVRLAEIEELMELVKRLEKKKRSRTHGLRRLYKVGLSRRVKSFVEASLGDQEDASKQGMIADIDVDAGITLASVLNDEEVFTGHNMAEKEVSTVDPVTTTSVEPEKSTKKKDQIRLDKELAFKLQAEEEEEERLAREKVKANVALIEEWNDIQAKIEADQLLAKTLQAREQEELTTEERAKLFQQS